MIRLLSALSTVLDQAFSRLDGLRPPCRDGGGTERGRRGGGEETERHCG